MSLSKRVLFYGLLAALTLLAVEGMARLAYMAAFGEWYGGGAPTGDGAVRVTALPKHPKDKSHRMLHPFYAHGVNHPEAELNVTPPRQKRDDLVLVGLFGGSVAGEVTPALQQALSRYFSDNDLSRRPVALPLNYITMQQPQQVMIAVHALLLGGHFDLIINLDGFNEMDLPPQEYQDGRYPHFPRYWNFLMNLSAVEQRLAGRIGLLREQQAELRRRGAVFPLRYTAIYGIANSYRRQRIEGEIIQLNIQLVTARAAYSLERSGPGLEWPHPERELYPAVARAWYRSSLLLAELAELAGAEYYHFLQPNQYVPGAKPLTNEELECCYRQDGRWIGVYRDIYPRSVGLLEKLPQQEVNYFDLTPIFRDNRETLYRDYCCHYNERGNELLAAAMVERMAPALQRMGNARPPVSGLDAAAAPAELLIDGPFQVYRRAGNRLLYVREDCAPSDSDAAFFLHIIPADAADLPPERREYGFDNRDFRFADAGHLTGGRCAAGRPLPAYSIAAIRTGQYVDGDGKLWEKEYRFAE